MNMCALPTAWQKQTTSHSSVEFHMSKSLNSLIEPIIEGIVTRVIKGANVGVLLLSSFVPNIVPHEEPVSSKL